jgi:Sulfotransferase family
MRDRLAWTLRSLSPRAWRWRRFLHDLPLDPDLLPRPLPAPGPRDLIVCGPSRSGTTLVAAALFQPPRVMTVVEPWDGMRMAPADLFASLRREIDATGVLTRGRLDVEALRREGAAVRGPDGHAPVPLDVEEGFLLGVKWPVYWRYLELLPQTRFVVCLRHPVEVIASFKRSGARLARGLDYDTAFNRRMNEELLAATDDPAVRRVLFHDYAVSRILPHLGRPNVFAVRYERWFSDPSGLLDELGAFLGVRLEPDVVRIRGPEPPRLPPEELELVAARCTTAAALGYSVSPVAGG